jgi:hypothetical protein
MKTFGSSERAIRSAHSREISAAVSKPNASMMNGESAAGHTSPVLRGCDRDLSRTPDAESAGVFSHNGSGRAFQEDAIHLLRLPFRFATVPLRNGAVFCTAEPPGKKVQDSRQIRRRMRR